jgi:hypothetical protein
LVNTKFESNYNDQQISTREITIITDKNLVKNIFTNQKNKINELGEFVDYDVDQFKNIIMNDINKYKESYDFYPDYVESFYYIKCEIINNISVEINNYINNL